jgi:cardiolipin synthase
MKDEIAALFNPETSHPDEDVELVFSGSDYFDRLETLIDNAQKLIHFQTYIYNDDVTGKRISAALLKAVARGIKIYILLDAYGSSAFPNKRIEEFAKAGINIRLFAPFFSTNTFYLGRRLHHKVIVVDTDKAMLGGINVADKYNILNAQTPWLDYAVLISDSTTAAHLQVICEAYYHKKRRFKKKPYYNKETKIQVLQNDWLKGKTNISDAHVKAIRQARTDITIVGSYFLPGYKLTKALIKAAQRGVKIKIILAGISDVALSKSAGNYLYSTFLNNNMELYEWHQSVVHGKAVVIDGKWSTIGSFNVNHLSSYGSIEMNAVIRSQPFAYQFMGRLNEVIENSEQITLDKFKLKNGFFTKIHNWFTYNFVRFAFISVTYLPFSKFLKKYINE